MLVSVGHGTYQTFNALITVEPPAAVGEENFSSSTLRVPPVPAPGTRLLHFWGVQLISKMAALGFMLSETMHFFSVKVFRF